jgi:hypothetical protein
MPTTDDPFLPVQGTQGRTPSGDFDLGLDTSSPAETTGFNLNL